MKIDNEIEVKDEKALRIHNIIRQLFDELEGQPYDIVSVVLHEIKRVIDYHSRISDKIEWDKDKLKFFTTPYEGFEFV